MQSLGENGLAALQRATELSPEDAELHANLATALHFAGRLDAAEEVYRRAAALARGNSRVRLNLASLLIDRRRFNEAETCIRQVLDAQPGDAEALFCLGNLYRDGGRLDDAKSSYLAAIKSVPNFPPAYNNLGNVALELGDVSEAIEFFRQALRLDPNYGEAHANLALALSESGRLIEAEASYRQALRLNPRQPGWHGKLGQVLQERGELAGAREAYLRQLEIDPDAGSAKLALAMLALPVAPASAAESEAAPRNFAVALTDLSAWLTASAARRAALAACIGSQQPFYLAYRDGNHVELLSHYGDLVAGAEAGGLPRAPGARIKLLVVSNHIRRHSVWDVVLRGLLCELDRGRFEVIVYHTGTHEDDETAFAKSIVDHWRDRRQFPHLENLVAAIGADAPDVILYPEIGMDPFSFKLAARRLAPLQLASWGHPITTGLPTIDGYLSGELLESDGAQEHYRERLVRLPGTGCCTSALQIDAEPIAEIEARLATRKGARYLIAQRTFKFDPKYDHVYAEIAVRAGECSFLLLQDPVYPWAGAQVRARLERAFAARGLAPEKHLVDVPWLSPGQFFSLLDLADVFLDCPAFSGYTTAWQALHRGMPVVTLEGAYLRQRLAAGLLRKIEMPATIAASIDQYITLAAELASDSTATAAKRRAAVKAAAGKADGDLSVVRAFEAYVTEQLAQL